MASRNACPLQIKHNGRRGQCRSPHALKCMYERGHGKRTKGTNGYARAFVLPCSSALVAQTSVGSARSLFCCLCFLYLSGVAWHSTRLQRGGPPSARPTLYYIQLLLYRDALSSCSCARDVSRLRFTPSRINRVSPFQTRVTHNWGAPVKPHSTACHSCRMCGASSITFYRNSTPVSSVAQWTVIRVDPRRAPPRTSHGPRCSNPRSRRTQIRASVVHHY